MLESAVLVPVTQCNRTQLRRELFGAAEKISVQINTRGNPLSDIELVLQDGSVLKPEVVRSKSGKEVALRMVNDSPAGPEGLGASLDTTNQPSILVVTFGRAMTEAGPRHLVVTPASGETTSILLANVKRELLPKSLRPYGYSQEHRTFPDGAIETVYVRSSADESERFEISEADFTADVSPCIERMYTHLPETAEEIQDCPEVTQFLAELFEQGVSYEGPTESKDKNAQMRGPQFWTSASRVVFYDDEGREQRAEDPLSTITRFILAAVNSSNSSELQEIYDAAISGEMDETTFIRSEALYKAANLRRTMEILRAGHEGLAIEDWREKKYGHYFKLYSSWVLEAEVGSDSDEAALSKLAGIILSSLSRSNIPGEKPIAYHMKLQRIHRDLIEPADEEF